MRHKIYLSGPLFSRSEIAWGKRVKAFLEEGLQDTEVIWPHEISAASPEQIFQANLKALNECNSMVAILDGPQVDDGTAWEVGYFFMQGKGVHGIRTDLRRAGESERSRVNLMVEFSCQSLAASLDELLTNLLRHLD
jgi:nucleoside 2-deoxyribosyltransferase